MGEQNSAYEDENSFPSSGKDMANKSYKSNDSNVPNDHAARIVAIKSAEVDDDILFLVKWLNSFSGVFTRWSCDGGGKFEMAYISFYCDCQGHLWDILREIGFWVKIEVDRVPDQSMLRYRMAFCSPHSLAEIKKYLNQEKAI